MAATADDSERLRSTERALDLLEALQAASDVGMSLTVAARIAGMPKSTTLRYLATLEARGFVERDPQTAVYRLGPSVPSQAALAVRLTRSARATLERVRDRFRETVTLGVLDGDRVAYVDVLEGPEPIRFTADITERNYLHSSAGGKAILSTMPERTVRRLIAIAGLPAVTPRTVVDERELLDQLERVRSDGYALSDEENVRGGRSVGVPVVLGSVRAALTLSAPVSRLSLDEVGDVAAGLRGDADLLVDACST